jgi:hypothetical protein
LGSGAERVTILLQGISVLFEADLFLVHVGELASLKQVPHSLRGLDLTASG